MIVDSMKSARPLSGVRILVGRARQQAGSLSRELRKLGAEVLEIPFIEIRTPRSFQSLDSALKNLDSYDWLILTSVNGVEAMWERLAKLKLDFTGSREGPDFSRALRSRGRKTALAAEGPGPKHLRIAAIGPATKKAIEQRGGKVDVVPKEYVAESVVRSLRRRVTGKRVLLVRAKVARDVIPRELRRAGAHVDVVEAYETIVPTASGRRLQSVLTNRARRPHLVTFTSSSTVRNFVALLESHAAAQPPQAFRGQECPRHINPRYISLDGILLASIGPVTSSTLRELDLDVDIQARQFTIPGLVVAITQAFAKKKKQNKA
jgi:uroporphyrinogen-III synthase